MAALAPLLIRLLIAVVLFLVALFYALATYKKALTNAQDAWWMRCFGGGRRFLRLISMIIPKSVVRRAQIAEGKAKIAALARQNPASGGVCFIGSSTFTFWRFLRRDMEKVGIEIPVFNAAFGGSWTSHLLPLVDGLCVKWSPSLVVYFCGTNDLLNGMPIDAPLKGFKAFLKLLPPNVKKVVYLNATVTPFVRMVGDDLVKRYEASNRMVQEYVGVVRAAADDRDVRFVSSAGEDFASDLKMYLGDWHHLNDEGHKRLAALLAPTILDVLKQ